MNKILLLGLLALGSIPAFANEAACSEAIEQVSITTSLLKEYEMKKSISPEMEENRIRIVEILKARLSLEKEEAVRVCVGK